MKRIVLFFLAGFIFVAGFQKSLLYFDYAFNKDFYEIHCINKKKPELSCHGKCQLKKESEKKNSDITISGIGFDINMISGSGFSFDFTTIVTPALNKVFSTFTTQPLTGYFLSFPKPPQV